MRIIKNKFGYTLFELLVSISIIAVLVAVATASYSGAQKKARDSRRIEDLNSIQKAAEMFYSQNGYRYPKDSDEFSTVLQTWPSNPKGDAYVYNNIGTTYCACASMDNVTGGNSSNTSCAAGVGGTGEYYCVRSQQ